MHCVVSELDQAYVEKPPAAHNCGNEFAQPEEGPVIDIEGAVFTVTLFEFVAVHPPASETVTE